MHQFYDNKGQSRTISRNLIFFLLDWTINKVTAGSEKFKMPGIQPKYESACMWLGIIPRHLCKMGSGYEAIIYHKQSKQEVGDVLGMRLWESRNTGLVPRPRELILSWSSLMPRPSHMWTRLDCNIACHTVSTSQSHWISHHKAQYKSEGKAHDS